MATATTLSAKQVKTWFNNERRRRKPERDQLKGELAATVKGHDVTKDDLAAANGLQSTLTVPPHQPEKEQVTGALTAALTEHDVTNDGERTGLTSAPAPEPAPAPDVDGNRDEGNDSSFGDLQSLKPSAPLTPNSEKEQLKDELAAALKEHDATKGDLAAANELATTLTVPPHPLASEPLSSAYHIGL